MIEREMARLLDDAKRDEKLKNRLLQAKSSGDPMGEFCRVCNEQGYNISLGELFALGMDMNDSKMRAVNGGGAFEIEGWDDAFENFFQQL